MNSVGVHTPGMLPLAHGNDAFFEDISTQMALSQAARRLSRGSGGQRPGSMARISKPNSASNSPRNSMTMNRRRTIINDAYTSRKQQPTSDYFSAISTKSNRPVSWHPSTHLQPLPLQYQQPAYLSTPSMCVDTHDANASQSQFSPMMASYSNNTSPASAFSPLPLAYGGADISHFTPDAWSMGSRAAPCYTQPEKRNVPEQEHFPAFSASMQDNALTSTTADWNTFIMHGFNSTSPPTPDSFLPAHQLEPAVSSNSRGYQALEEPEEEGEVLVGMGLYDAPEKYQEDPHLNNYRTTVSSLLGSKFLPKEPQGKGLKLEETWEPPKSDDEEENEQDEDEADEE